MAHTMSAKIPSDLFSEESSGKSHKKNPEREKSTWLRSISPARGHARHIWFLPKQQPPVTEIAVRSIG